jgi:hypothetical protein
LAGWKAGGSFAKAANVPNVRRDGVDFACLRMAGSRNWRIRDSLGASIRIEQAKS